MPINNLCQDLCRRRMETHESSKSWREESGGGELQCTVMGREGKGDEGREGGKETDRYMHKLMYVTQYVHN